MTLLPLIAGLLLFLGVHSTRVFGEGFRTAQIARLGLNGWKSLYALASIAGFVLIVWGYSLAQQQPIALWSTPVALRHLAAPLTLIAFIFLVATYVPGNGIKARLHHPMILAVKIWAIAHLLANNSLADLLLFGSFLLWAVVDFRAARARDRTAGTVYPAGHLTKTLLCVGVGTAAWAAFAFWAHAAWIGVRPIG